MKKIDIIAMGIFASGSNYNERSVKNYLRKFRSLKGLVIGISDIKMINQTQLKIYNNVTYILLIYSNS